MSLFQIVLIVVFSVGILSKLARLGGWNPDPPTELGIGVALVLDVFMIAGIIAWL